ncbi:MAG: hypothetical protein ABIS03_11815 [Gemmatimonadaceae bacterium]
MGNVSLRGLIIAIVFIGMLGLAPELLLIKHFESWTQVIPLVSLGLGFAISLTVVRRPSRTTVRAFQVVMGLFVIAGLLGVFLHLKGNVEWALERDPSLAGGSLIWKALRGATPALAPGALAQLGLLGLAWAHRHPAVKGNHRLQEIDS